MTLAVRDPDPRILEGMEALYEFAAGGDVTAEHYLRSLIKVSEQMDDLIDGDRGEFSARMKQELLFQCLVGMPENLFFQANFNTLKGVHLIVLNAWIESDELRSRGLEIHWARGLALIVLEVFPLVAFLTGPVEEGYMRMRTASAMVRDWVISMGYLDRGVE